MEECAHAQSVRDFSGIVGRSRVPGGTGGCTIQEWQPSDGVKFADAEPASGGDAANRVDGYYDHLSRAFRGRTRNLGQDDTLRQSMARGREREYDDHVCG